MIGKRAWVELHHRFVVANVVEKVVICDVVVAFVVINLSIPTRLPCDSSEGGEGRRDGVYINMMFPLSAMWPNCSNISSCCCCTHRSSGTDDLQKARSGFFQCSNLYGGCIPKAEYSALLPKNAAVNHQISLEKFDCPLAANMHLTIASKALRIRLSMLICCGVLVLVYSSTLPFEGSSP